MFSPAWLRNFVAACGLARSTAAYGGLQWRLWGLVQIQLFDWLEGNNSFE